jgi:hypothetical protein
VSTDCCRTLDRIAVALDIEVQQLFAEPFTGWSVDEVLETGALYEPVCCAMSTTPLREAPMCLVPPGFLAPLYM